MSDPYLSPRADLAIKERLDKVLVKRGRFVAFVSIAALAMALVTNAIVSVLFVTTDRIAVQFIRAVLVFGLSLGLLNGYSWCRITLGLLGLLGILIVVAAAFLAPELLHDFNGSNIVMLVAFSLQVPFMFWRHLGVAEFQLDRNLARRSGSHDQIPQESVHRTVAGKKCQGCGVALILTTDGVFASGGEPFCHECFTNQEHLGHG